MEYISDPMTMLTDYILGAFAFAYGAALLHCSQGQKTRRYWSFAFFALALSAILGGTYHGLFGVIDEFQKIVLWKSTLILTGFVSLFLLLAGVRATITKKKVQTVIVIFGILKFLVFVGVATFSNQFLFVIVDYGMNLIIVSGLYMYGLNNNMTRVTRNYILVGVVVSFVAAGIQLSKYRINENFNHNDLYHVIQIVSLHFLFRGARRLIDIENRGYE